jgi:hypothetical protein
VAEPKAAATTAALTINPWIQSSLCMHAHTF